MTTVDMMDKAMVRLHARMKALMWGGRENSAAHLFEMARIRDCDGSAHAAWAELCSMRRRYWEAVANG